MPSQEGEPTGSSVSPREGVECLLADGSACCLWNTEASFQMAPVVELDSP